VDLFSALLVLTFGGLLLSSSRIQTRDNEVKFLLDQNQKLSDSKQRIQSDLERYKGKPGKSDILPACPGKHIQLEVIGKQVFVAGQMTLSGAEMLKQFKPQLDLATAQGCKWVVELSPSVDLSARDYAETQKYIHRSFRVGLD
jgi:hypothetical protein